MKYYFFSFVERLKGTADWTPCDYACEAIHPLKLIQMWTIDRLHSETRLVAWQEISELEYKMWTELHGIRRSARAKYFTKDK